ncbi:DUF2846 domain-containing protein [Cobetia sp. 10Alg 146]|uniref:DUF2846 domain-containing protein n=1 Tax=Cobetia sp. 10Alg 146 TaxID=3040019 RepID=UPI00244A36EF|nr:DUF2846 domain-containing protein [Cobetia sp. 10Alg 146]MDH2289964.1 DUF2846 domain-containing protein [Cobetia sp. 10Alg 146]
MKLLKYASTAVFLSVMTGCASVNMTPIEDSTEAKKFEMPNEGMAGIYIYRRDSMFGAAIKKDIWIDGDCVGETAPGIFFYEQVKGGENYKISTESEFSPNALSLAVQPGANYYIEQYMKVGIFVGGANLRLVDADKGMLEVSSLDMAVKGNCS